MHWWSGHGTGWMGGMGAGWVVIAWVLGAILIAAVVWALLKAERGRMASPATIIERRYAKGEVDSETYQKMLADLGS